MGSWFLNILAFIGLRLGVVFLYLASIGGIIYGFVLMDANNLYLGLGVCFVSFCLLAWLNRPASDDDR